jgi:SPP1 family predicted phage head-tail adaptor
MRLSSNRIKESNAGTLPFYVDVLTPTSSTDFEGGFTVTYALLKNVYAKIEPRQNSRVLEQAQITFNAAAKIIVRHDPAITTDCRIKYEGIEYVIHSVVDIGYSARYMELLAYTTN